MNRLAVIVVVAALTSACHHEASIMDQPITATTEESFAASMAAIEAQATPDQFRQVQEAVAYLMLHDLENVSREAFVESLNGKTPEELIALAASQQEG